MLNLYRGIKPIIIMKSLLVFLLIATASANVWDYESGPADILKGFFEGVGEKGNAMVFFICLITLPEPTVKLWEAYEYFINLEIVKGVKTLIEAIKLYDRDIDKCLVDYKSLKRLVDGMRKATIWLILKRSIFSFVDLAKHQISLIKCLFKLDYFCIGYEIGFILKITFVDESFKPTTIALGTNQGLNFITGLLKGIGERESPVDLMKCLYGLKPSIQKIKEGLKQIKTAKFVNITQGLIKVLEGIKEILRQGTPCFDKYEVIRDVFREIRQTSFKELFVRLMSNLPRLIIDINFAINGFLSNDFESAGKGIGDILKFLYLY